MRIAMICPSNNLFMPYVENYKNILDENKIQYTIINWDRIQMEDENNMFTYRDSKLGHQRNLNDYYKYKRFVILKLQEHHFDKVIIFGLQMAFFLRNYLLNYFKGKYSIDIRDHNKIISFFNMKRLIKHSALTVISSPGYKQFLPKDEEYVINHNTRVESLKELVNREICLNKKKLRISCIGALRDYEINILLINSLKENEKFELSYHGEGEINKVINDFIVRNEIKNVFLTGRYMKEQEEELYRNSDLINVFRHTDGVNNKTALPNRLYNSAQFKTPMIALNGSYLAEQIKEYRLGLVLDSFENFEGNIEKYITNFNISDYEQGILAFFRKVIMENSYFKDRLNRFCQND